MPLNSKQAVSPEIRKNLSGLLRSEKVSVGQIRAAVAGGDNGTTPDTTAGTKLTPKVQWHVVILYLVIIIVLGAALILDLLLGKDASNTFSSSIVTAITTIAGFGVGANVNPQTKGT